MVSELLGGDSKCEAWPLDQIDNEDDQFSPSPKFLFCLDALLSRPVVDDQEQQEEDEEEEDQLLVVPLDNMVDSIIVSGEKALDYDVVTDEERSKVAIKGTLSEIGVVPVQDFMTQRTLDTALSMSRNKRFVSRKVFRMGVCIEAIVDDLPPRPPPDDDDDDDNEDTVEFEPAVGLFLAELDDGVDEDMAELDDDNGDYDEYEDEDVAELGVEDWEPKFEPASTVSIEELDRVKVEGCLKEEVGCCSVCFDDCETGCEATRMPCLQLFQVNNEEYYVNCKVDMYLLFYTMNQ